MVIAGREVSGLANGRCILYKFKICQVLIIYMELPSTLYCNCTDINNLEKCSLIDKTEKAYEMHYILGWELFSSFLILFFNIERDSDNVHNSGKDEGKIIIYTKSVNFDTDNGTCYL